MTTKNSSKTVCWLLLLVLLSGCTRTPPTKARDSAPLSTTSKETTNRKLSVVAWNVESGGNNPNIIARQLAEFGDVDVYCLCEVHAKNFDKYANALPNGYVSIGSTTGGGDRLQILFNTNRFEILERKELHEHRDFELNNGNHRSPLMVRLRDRKSSIQFIVMTNHLARRNSDLRRAQAIGLREWARDQNVAVINVGDFNLDYNFLSDRGNDALPEMLRDGIWHWVKPDPLIDTNWSDPDGDGRDNYPDSMLDFAFVSGPAKDWSPKCDVVVREGDFPDDEETSDHRPIKLTLDLK